MEIEFTKGQREDRIAIRRDDGTGAVTTFPHKGPVAHDAVHFFVERELGLRNAFWGMVAAGRHPGELAELAKAAGHASAKRARVPDPEIVELVQAERIVESFEAEMWSGGADDDGLLAMAEGGCVASHVPLPPIAPGSIAAARAALRGFAEPWSSAATGFSVVLTWP